VIFNLTPIVHADQSLFLSLNSLHCPFLDPVMYWGTKTIVWLPLFLLLLYFTIRTYKWKTVTVILTLTLTLLLSDQFANLAKSSVKRLRPSHEASLVQVIHTVNDYTGGQYGFYSSHASNTMAIAVFLILLLRTRYRRIAMLILPWTLFMSYTRIYLGVHYPGDILAGMLVGGVLGWIGAQGCGYLFSSVYK